MRCPATPSKSKSYPEINTLRRAYPCFYNEQSCWLLEPVTQMGSKNELREITVVGCEKSTADISIEMMCVSSVQVADRCRPIAPVVVRSIHFSIASLCIE